MVDNKYIKSFEDKKETFTSKDPLMYAATQFSRYLQTLNDTHV